jgi:uncharacterized protein YcnI
MKRIAAISTFITLLALPVAADAHISLHPNTIPAGAFVTLDVRVPGEEQGAYADKIIMQIPPGFTEIDTQNVSGWTVHETIKDLKTPLQTSDGPVSQEISQITWTGNRSVLGRIDNGYFMQFPLSIAMPTAIAGKSLAFKTVEYYSNGVTAYWIGPPSANYPAPTINITKAGGVIEDVAGNEAGPLPGKAGSSLASAAPVPKQGSSSTLAIIAIALAAAALLLGAANLLGRRRQGRASQ